MVRGQWLPRTGHTVKSLVKEESITMQSIEAMTVEVISSLDLSKKNIRSLTWALLMTVAALAFHVLLACLID